MSSKKKQQKIASIFKEVNALYKNKKNEGKKAILKDFIINKMNEIIAFNETLKKKADTSYAIHISSGNAVSIEEVPTLQPSETLVQSLHIEKEVVPE
jgi:hypothetical protein